MTLQIPLHTSVKTNNLSDLTPSTFNTESRLRLERPEGSFPTRGGDTDIVCCLLTRWVLGSHGGHFFVAPNLSELTNEKS